ncbi:MAG: hypothetical protein M2R45_00287 [Verrucomicrobia subdivision 3 bacterium]|nr:hypothetical protein [Limisphaerales bacterium]MCS1412953.1 hypothetical protein [Limisphaerales bacterium]
MLSFVHPYMLILLLFLPILAWIRGRRSRGAAFLYSSVKIVEGIINLRRSQAGGISTKLRWLALALCIIALARPRLGEGETAITASGIDIVVALDLSGSMAAEDFTILGNRVNRLAAAKNVLKEFIDKRRNDRIGLVAFARRAYIAAPLTLDHDFLLQNLERLNLGTIEDGTSIGSAMTAGLNRLRDIVSKSRIMILMTDGQNNAGKVPPLTAAEAAESLDVKIYTIGVGKRGPAPFPQQGPFGRKVYAQVEVNIDEDTLTEIAKITNGKYYRADNTDTLIEIYEEIDQLEKSEVEITEYQNYEEIFHWFLLPGFVLILLETILNHTVWRRLP